MHTPGTLLVIVAFFTFSKASLVCDKCSCSDDALNCMDLHFKSHFNSSDWPNATEVIIKEARFDNNELEIVTQLPTLAITYLSYKNNFIVHIENSAFKNLQNLTELDLSYNELTSRNLLPDVFKGKFLPDEAQPLHNLHILRLGNNALHSLNKDLFIHIPHVKILSLDSNPLQVLDSVTIVALNTLPDLEVLDLSYTNLADLPPYLLHTPINLRVLNLTGNLMIQVPDALKKSSSLEELHFCGNPVTVLDKNNGFHGLRKLRALYISYMQNLTRIEEGSFRDLPSLEELHMSHSKHLRKIDPAALSWISGGEESEQWPPIKKLNIAHNDIRSVERHLLGRWDSLEYLGMAGNPWLCDCENQWMVSELLPMAKELLKDQIDDLTCMEPIEMRNRKLHKLAQVHYQMRCLDIDGNQPEKDAKLLVGVLVGVLIAVPLTMAAVFLFHRTGYGRTLFARRNGHSDYSKAFYSRANSVDNI